ncbi:MAG: tRNA preQ1(34) S-adenosylmethionine ribosyltransferase-isomerase QueA [Oscillospiraceae bacterium]|nr:tRNA preQ1(34) S-adenosylmethionine ribosyltransferase-isomerase QueA [Oscillospiraceae bacterium]
MGIDFTKRSTYYYDLPQEQIAQTPAEPRSSSRLLCLDRGSGALSHHHFYELGQFLRPGDLLVMNDSRVLPARLYGVRTDTGSPIEFLLLKPTGEKVWEIICKPAKKAKPGVRFRFGDKLEAEVLGPTEDGGRLVRFTCEGSLYAVLDEIGQMPLPPYITEKLRDRERYQTVYSREPGSSAAPTAGLHFTPELLEELKNQGVDEAFVTLHVGLGTFRPVKEDDIRKHHMHIEHYTIPAETAEKIRRTKENGGRVIAVGTTSCRTLEGAAAEYGEIRACEGDTGIFIYPPYDFRVIDGLITNFHLPESTLIMLVSAFAGYDNIMNAYQTAVQEKYRFFSFGDAMFIGDLNQGNK